MATGKHYRSGSAAPKATRSPAKNTRSKAKTTVEPDPYEDLYSYEEPRGARRGTRRAVYHAPKKRGSDKRSLTVGILCMLAAAGIVFYILWDLGIINMILTLLG